MKYIKVVFLIVMWGFKKMASEISAFFEDPLKETGRLALGASALLAIIGSVLSLSGEEFFSKYILLIFAPILAGLALLIYMVVMCDNITEPWVFRKRNTYPPLKGWAIQTLILTITLIAGGWMYLDGMAGFAIHVYKGESWWLLNVLELTIAVPVLFVGLSILQETIWRVRETLNRWDDSLSQDEDDGVLETQP